MDLKRQIETGIKLRGADKVARIPIKILPTEELPTKPDWIRAKITDFEEINRIKNLLRQQKLHSVCEEAACPNLPECFVWRYGNIYDYGRYLYSSLPIL